MKTHKIFIGSLLLSFVFTVLLLPATPASVIIGGQPDENRYPYVGALDVRPTGRRIPCTGTLVSPTIVLTAGHCTHCLAQASLTEAKGTFERAFTDTVMS